MVFLVCVVVWFLLVGIWYGGVWLYRLFLVGLVFVLDFVFVDCSVWNNVFVGYCFSVLVACFVAGWCVDKFGCFVWLCWLCCFVYWVYWFLLVRVRCYCVVGELVGYGWCVFWNWVWVWFWYMGWWCVGFLVIWFCGVCCWLLVWLCCDDRVRVKVVRCSCGCWLLFFGCWRGVYFLFFWFWLG